MRSRDGDFNLPFTVSVSFFLLLFSPFTFGDEYLISYRYLVKDAILYNEQLSVAKTMQPCKGVPSNPIILENTQDEKLQTLLRTNNEEFIAYIHKLGLHVSHQDTTQNYRSHSITTLTLRTTCFKVEFNDNSVTMSPLK